VAQLLFPDNTVLINFALINRMDLLERLANGHGRWCATVAAECAQSASVAGLEALNDAHGIFGPPLYPENPSERIDVQTFRRELAQPGDPIWQHLGEAETLAIMTRRSVEGFLVTDDNDARRLARRHQVTVVSTWDLLRVAAKYSFVDRPTLWGYLQTLRAKQRGGPRGVTDRATFDKWIDGQASARP
jgi:predicted nucleic acid-binding protein